jgi:outer membrane protein OmpA-like peptidoglycan-associated protein
MRNAVAFVLAALTLSACGKSLHLSEKPESKLQIKRNMLGDPIAQKVTGLSDLDLKNIKENDLVPFGEEGVQFRALHYLPEGKVVESVSSLKLHLKGAKISDLSHATLCLLEKGSKICSGTEIPSGFTASVEGQALPIVADSEVKDSYSIDLIEAFGLKGKSAEEILAFLEKNSSDYDGKGYRKFIFSIGKNIRFEEGSFEIQTELKKGVEPVAIEVPGAPLNEGDDASAETPLASPTESTAERKLGTTESVQEKPAAPLKSAEVSETVTAEPARAEPVTAESVTVEKVADSTVIYFYGRKNKNGKYEQYLKDDAQEKLDRITNQIASLAESIQKVMIQCQTDLHGTVERNTVLSQERADFVKKNLAEKAPLMNITAVGEGSVARSSCGNKKTCLKDRKIVITVTMKNPGKTAQLQGKLDEIR